MDIGKLKSADKYPQVPWLDADNNFIYYDGVKRMEIPPINGLDHTVIKL